LNSIYPSWVLNIPFIVSMGIYYYMNFKYGKCSFEKLKLNGPYEVGHKEFFSEKYGQAVSVFYPMDKKKYDELIGASNSLWNKHGMNFVIGHD
jgi:hypothetical protein